ncbi:MAG TPA: hypothetical protein VMF51_18150 [Nocardioides sp.]|uniref:hypothetical protein n=1 Tax=Nocardioides sp. TaxID=35761 RepID=UPI002CDFB4D9|nr:hypothetical protein [Nocardioides sp.]HTW17058.1 hypothetical protein [Nocardioides sp.]
MTARVLVNVSEAARTAGVPRTTVATWISSERLFPVGLDADGRTALYDLASVKELAAATPRRKRRRSTRRSST